MPSGEVGLLVSVEGHSEGADDFFLLLFQDLDGILRQQQVARMHLEYTALFSFPQEGCQLLDSQRFHLLIFQFCRVLRL